MAVEVSVFGVYVSTLAAKRGLLLEGYFIVLFLLFNKLIQVAVDVLCQLSEARLTPLIEGVADHGLLVRVVVSRSVFVKGQKVRLVGCGAHP